MRMLDLACGTGLVSGPASQIVGPQGCVVSLDAGLNTPRDAVEKGRVDRAVQGRCEQVPFADSAFEFLCKVFALRRVADMRDAFGEYHRLLKLRGTILLLEITPPSCKLS